MEYEAHVSVSFVLLEGRQRLENGGRRTGVQDKLGLTQHRRHYYRIVVSWPPETLKVVCVEPSEGLHKSVEGPRVKTDTLRRMLSAAHDVQETLWVVRGEVVADGHC